MEVMNIYPLPLSSDVYLIWLEYCFDVSYSFYTPLKISEIFVKVERRNKSMNCSGFVGSPFLPQSSNEWGQMER
jgi:hypothetical protein